MLLFRFLRALAVVVGTITVVMVPLGLASNPQLGAADVLMGSILFAGGVAPPKHWSMALMLVGFAGTTAVFTVSVTISVIEWVFNPETTIAVVFCAIATVILTSQVAQELKSAGVIELDS